MKRVPLRGRRTASEPTSLRCVRVSVPRRAAGAVVAALEDLADSVSCFAADGSWTVEAICTRFVDRPALEARIAVAAASAGAPPPPVAVEPLSDVDWVEATRRGFPPFAVGRYFIHGSHFRGRVPGAHIGLVIDAGAAFGTGLHESTRGCLLALDALAARGRRFRNALDLGCGSGILAIAVARTWDVPVIACDNDPRAVEVARANAAVNGVAHRVSIVRSDGYRAAAVRRSAPFDLIVANILARPLARMAADLERHLAAQGTAMLAGVLAGQEGEVLVAHRARGLTLTRRIAVDGWHTLVLGRRRRGTREKRSRRKK